jgi:hypothetical protein
VTELLVTPDRNVQVRDVMVEKRLVDVPVNAIVVPWQAGLGEAAKEVETVSTFMVSAPRLMLSHPVESVRMSFGR